jgi:exopolysaccharide production protein ExoZ
MEVAMRSKIVSLQIGRGLAALAIVIQHAALSIGTGPPNSVWAGLVANLGVGVDFFFVLSGFIILMVHVNDPPGMNSATRFLRKRLTRIFIPYIPLALAMIAILESFPGISTDPNRQWSILGSLTLLPLGGRPALPVAWSLTFEMTFYLLFMCVYLLRRPVGLGLAIVFAALWFTSLSDTAWDNVRTIFLSAYALEFVYGILTALVVCRLDRPLTLLPITGLIFVAGYLISHGFTWRPLMGAGMALLVFCATQLEAIAIRRRDGFVFPRPWVRLGDASYSVYLIHGPVIAVMSRLLVPHPWWLVASLYVLVSTATGVAYHFMVERPLLARIQ